MRIVTSSSAAARLEAARRFILESSPAAEILIVSASRGTFGPYQLIEAVPDGVAGHWRAQFDLIVDGTDPVELRAFLKSGGEILTETWMFQYHPF